MLAYHDLSHLTCTTSLVIIFIIAWPTNVLKANENIVFLRPAAPQCLSDHFNQISLSNFSKIDEMKD